MVMIASFKTAKLRQRLQETHVNYTGSHVTLYTVFVREYALSLFYVLLVLVDLGECFDSNRRAAMF